MCGIFGAVSVNYEPDLTRRVVLGLFDNQHRGQESTGLAWSNGSSVWVRKDFGLVADVFKEDEIKEINLDKPTMFIGQTRYSTSGSKNSPKNKSSRLIPPHFSDSQDYGRMALVQNGNMPSSDVKIKDLENAGVVFNRDSNINIVDTEYILRKIIFMAGENGNDLLNAVKEFIATIEGTYSAALIYYGGVIVFRDRYGNRPLFWCKDENDTVFFSSETCALDNFDERDINILKPGEILFLPSDLRMGYGMKVIESDFKHCQKAHCDFEDLYLARPSSRTFGSMHVRDFRERVGAELAKLFPVPDADFVSFVPDSGMYYAKGFSAFTGIPLEFIYERNSYVQGRSFISPTPADRAAYSQIKNHLIKYVIEGKRMVLTDDSIVRGDTLKLKIKDARKTGAKEIHLRIGSPQYKSPCYYGVDTPEKEKLISANLSEEDLKNYLGADSLKFLPLDALRKIQVDCEYNPNDFCKACFTGDYPIPLS